MINEHNLKHFTKANAKEMGKKGGKKSAIKRAEQKSLKEQLTVLMSLGVANENDYEKLKEIGLNDSEISNQALLVYSLYERALNGDLRAVELIFKTLISEDTEKNSKKWDCFNDIFPI